MIQSTFHSVVQRILPAPIPKPLESFLSATLGVAQLENIYEEIRGADDGTSIVPRLLQRLQITEHVSEAELARIPKTGPVLLVANHPFGILEGVLLGGLVSRVRRDVKILANGILARFPEGRDLIIPVDPFGGHNATRSNHTGVRAAIEFLAAGGLLIVFPAGEVAHFDWKRRHVTDPPWNPAIARILGAARRKAANVSVVPTYIAGRNSLLFQAAGAVYPRLRTALLGRELLNKRGACVDIRIGSAVPADKLLSLPSNAERIDYLRWRTYLLASRNDYKPRTGLPLIRRRNTLAAQEPIAPAADAGAMAREVSSLSPLLAAADLTVYAARAHEIPTVLQEIGRLREIAFRAVGEGTGRSRDLDSFDSHYLHLFLWNARTLEIAGAYRLTATDITQADFDVRGLYTATLFEYDEKFLHQIGPALELGRSFVRIEYQRALAPLLLLWKGIARYVAQNPRYKILFGAVSISNLYQSVSRRLMISFLEQHAQLTDWTELVRSRNPFPSCDLPGRNNEPLDLEDLSAVVSDLDPTLPGVPVLLRQYLKLGGRLLGFNVDPQFSNTLDGLILVDLTKTEPRLLEPFLGSQEAARFWEFHRGAYATQ